MKQITCPGCHKPISMESIAFCPYCGASLKATPKEGIPEEIRKGLADIAKTFEPKKKNQMMDALLQKYPDSLEVNEEKLFLVGVMDSRQKRLDFSVIKSHLLHFYLTPNQFTQEQSNAMREEIFHHPELDRCLALAPDAESFMTHYLERLCKEFVSLFIHSSSNYNRTIFSFHSERNMDKKLAEPVAWTMRNIYRDQQLTGEQRDGLYRAMFLGFKADVGNTAFLEEKLGEYGLPLP